MKKNSKLALIEPIENRILCIREQRVILDFHLAELYGVSTKVLNQAVRRNIMRFPADFMFQLTAEEYDSLRSQFVTLESGRGKHRKYRPYAFTEHGAVMAANVLKSRRAIQASIYVVRAFVKLKQFTASYRELAQKLDELEHNIATHDKAICSLFDAIRKLISGPEKPRRKIGFELRKKETRD